MKVTLLAPNVGSLGSFYAIFGDFLQAAARRLDVEVDVVDGTKHHETVLARAREIVNAPRRPDYMLLVNYMGVGREVIPINAAAGVGTFVVVEGLSAGEVGTMTASDGATAGYMGQIVSDDVEAGKMLAEILTSDARALGLADRAGKIQVGTVAGEHTQAGNARFRGWQALMKERADVVQAGFQYGAWEEETAKVVVSMMLRTSPEISVLWCSNDAMALGGLAAARDAGRHPGKDILIGGVDLSDRALAEVAAGELAVSIGGHVVDGARALLLLFDHHERRDLVPETQTTHFVAVKAGQADRYLRFMKGRAWRNVDFTRFSRIKNPNAPAVSLENMMAG